MLYKVIKALQILSSRRLVMNESLVQIAQNKQEIYALIESTGGEITGELETWLSQIETKFATKVDDYKWVQDELESEAERLKRQASEFSLVAKKLENVSENLKSRLKVAMQISGTDEIKGDIYRYKLTKLAPKLVIDSKELPPSYELVKTIYEPDKERIRKELLEGNTIPGATLEDVVSLRSYLNKGDRK